MTTESDRRLATLTAWVTAGLAFVLIFAISIVAVMTWQSVRLGQNAERLAELTTETHASLCAFKTDLERRHAGGEKFLRENPKGIPGIPAAQIEQSLSNQRATLDALSLLDCEGES